jgi:hypothetical protein
MSLDTTRLRLESAKTRVLDYIDNHLEEWVTEEVVQPTQHIAWGEGLSENAISEITIEREDYLKVKMVWNLFGDNGEPLGVWLENGTKEHIIEAKGELFGGANSLRWYSKGGKPIFRKKVKHPGTKGKHILKRGWEIGKPNLQKRIGREVNNWLQVDKIG